MIRWVVDKTQWVMKEYANFSSCILRFPTKVPDDPKNVQMKLEEATDITKRRTGNWEWELHELEFGEEE